MATLIARALETVVFAPPKATTQAKGPCTACDDPTLEMTALEDSQILGALYKAADAAADQAALSTVRHLAAFIDKEPAPTVMVNAEPAVAPEPKKRRRLDRRAKQPQVSKHRPVRQTTSKPPLGRRKM